jgi:hypothetical protein
VLEVEFYSGDDDEVPQTIALCEDDDETLSVDGVALENFSSALGDIFYRHDFDGPQSGPLEIVWDRPEEDTSVTVDVLPPETLEISRPAHLEEHSRAAELLVEWAPAGEESIVLEVRDELGVACLSENEPDLEIDDLGTYALPGNSLEPGGDLPPDGRCEVDLWLTRSRDGDYPSALAAGGSVTATVKRRVRFLSAP